RDGVHDGHDVPPEVRREQAADHPRRARADDPEAAVREQVQHRDPGRDQGAVHEDWLTDVRMDLAPPARCGSDEGAADVAARGRGCRPAAVRRVPGDRAASADQRRHGPEQVTRILVVDNYDSFVYNLVQYLGQLG